MNWTANYLIDGEQAYVIGEYATMHGAKKGLRTFLAGPGRTSPPVWWAWVESKGLKFYWEGGRWVID